MADKHYIGLTMLGVVLLTACGTTQEQASETSEAQPQQEHSTTAAAEAEDSSDDQQQDAPDATRDLADAVETISYPMQGYDGEITMGIFPPEVQGETMLVSVVFQPEFSDDSADDVRFADLHGTSGLSVLMPVVSDRQNFTVYHVPRMSTSDFAQGSGWTGGSVGDGTWASAIGDVKVQSGAQYLHWAYFPAPVDDIDTVDIAVIPGVQEFRDVEIDWGATEPGAGEEAAQDDA